MEFTFSIQEYQTRVADAVDEVVAYAKVPRTFQISTPVDSYAPDEVVAFRRDADVRCDAADRYESLLELTRG